MICWRVASSSARAIALGGAFLLAGLTAAAVANAAGPTAAERRGSGKTAKKLLSEGERALERKDFATALGRFRAAEEVQTSPLARLGEARAMVGLGQLAAAEQMYLSVLRGPGDKPVAHPPAGAAREEAALALQLPYATLVVKGAPKDAVVTVSIDGEALPAASASGQHAVDPGSHFARAESPGLETVETPFTAVEGEAQTVTLTFHGAPADSATTAEKSSSEANAPHHVRRTVGWATLVTGGAGIVFGAVTGALAAHKHSSLESACPGGVCPPSSSGDLSSYHTIGTLSTVGFIAGGALAAVGVVLVVLPTSKDPSPERASSADRGRGLVLAPVLAPGMVGTAGQWSF